MKNPPLSLFLLLVYCTLAMPAQAEKADRNKTMVFEAATMRLDDVKQVTVFDGNVVMTKGTIVVRAARVEVREDADGYQYALITGTPEKPAFFRQKREALDEFIEVESENIDYNGRSDVVKFTGNAVLRRLRGAVLADEISGALIVYENLTDKFSADGTIAKVGSVPVTGGRIRAMLTPKPEASASAPPSSPSSAPARPALRATNTLGSTPK